MSDLEKGARALVGLKVQPSGESKPTPQRRLLLPLEK